MTRSAQCSHPTPELVRAVTALAARAAEVDGVAPLSEAFRIALASPDAKACHLLAYAACGPDVRAPLAGYAQVAAGSCELVVDPAHRRTGIGAGLLQHALDIGATAFWAHGLLPAAQATAAGAGLELTRTLHLMGRPLTPADLADPGLPEWVRAIRYAERPEAEELLALNAAAFADHPEQGQLTLTALRRLMTQPWFNPQGLFLLFDRTQPASAPPIAFHWTKIEPDQEESGGHGEVYVVGVHPAYQGRGLAGPLTRLGLAQLARKGLSEVRLYVDGDNTAARRTYARLGFTDLMTDGQYTLPPTDVRMTP